MKRERYGLHHSVPDQTLLFVHLMLSPLYVIAIFVRTVLQVGEMAVQEILRR